MCGCYGTFSPSQYTVHIQDVTNFGDKTAMAEHASIDPGCIREMIENSPHVDGHCHNLLSGEFLKKYGPDEAGFHQTTS